MRILYQDTAMHYNKVYQAVQDLVERNPMPFRIHYMYMSVYDATSSDRSVKMIVCGDGVEISDR